ncbi:TetR/AcrR family transcriptional regulator C-terminal domain-containing protein [Allokutzneria oryzae]|uniref:TetR/AcrR family transcriptional regulator C-terminal domain-containing protein n=1 Tax=Allokutzneria oryzae TaxID=1378989 RepID=A0ABV5ZY22_9PSEU
MSPSEYSGLGDPHRSIALLWGTAEPPSRGPKQRLTVDRVVATAIEVADADGLDGLSMRKVAERLGVGTMSLYTYVPAKAELVDLMLDRATAEVRRPEEGMGWRERLELFAREHWRLYHRHPWMLQVTGHRPVLGPNELRAYDDALGALAHAGLDERDMVAFVDLVEGYVRGKARHSVDSAQAEKRTGISDDQWWSSRQFFWEKHFTRADYPNLTRVLDTDAFSEQGGSFEFGLARTLDGIEGFLRALD